MQSVTFLQTRLSRRLTALQTLNTHLGSNSQIIACYKRMDVGVGYHRQHNAEGLTCVTQCCNELKYFITGGQNLSVAPECFM